jgi:hypothetical protein
MKQLIFFLGFLISSLMLHAQNKKYNFSSLLQGGFAEGQSGTAGTIQTINGVQYKQWMAGIGTGIDYYNTRSVPAFLHIRRNILNDNKTPFVYLSGGYNFPWLNDEDKLSVNEAHGGLYYDAGIGYGVPVLKNSSLFFTVGFSSKKLSTESGGRPETIWSSFIPPFSNYEYTLRCINVRLGLCF